MYNVEPQSQTVDDIDNNIVKITDNEGKFCGTGFFIEINKQKYCITCHHCIYELDEIFIQRFNTKFNVEWMEKFSNPEQDIAVLKVDNSPFKPLLYAKEAMPNFKVSIRGFSYEKLKNLPEGTSGRPTTLSDSAKPYQRDPEEFVGKNKWNIQPKVYVNVYECEGKFEFGFSGSPACYNGPNKVVGMFTAKDDNYGYVIPIQTLLSKFEFKVLKNKEEEQPVEVPISQSNKNIKEILEKGNHHFENKEWNKAIDVYHAIIKDPNYLNAVCYIGRSLANIGRFRKEERQKALKYFEFVLMIEPNNIFALNGKGFALNGINEYIEAIKWFDKALEIDPNYVTAWFNKGFAHHILNQKSEAIECYSKVLELDPSHYNAKEFKKKLEK